MHTELWSEILKCIWETRHSRDIIKMDHKETGCEDVE
jgi:hypothetical protein